MHTELLQLNQNTIAQIKCQHDLTTVNRKPFEKKNDTELESINVRVPYRIIGISFYYLGTPPKSFELNQNSVEILFEGIEKLKKRRIKMTALDFLVEYHS